MQVLSKVFEVVTVIASNVGSLSKQDACIAIKGFTDKIADIKLKGPVCEGLTALSEALGPQFVFSQLHKNAAAHKSPKVCNNYSSAVAWFCSFV
jgi:cytoskeleton-associated protein 5